MKENKSPGVDGVSPKILRETVEQISTPLAYVSLQGQIEVFKILNGYENMYSNIFFLEIKESKITRGHNYKLVKKQSRLDVRK